MKYGFNLSNVSFGEGKTTFRIDSVKVDLEICVDEMKAQYDFGIQLINAIKQTVAEITPIVSNVVKEHDAIRHDRRMEEIEKMREVENEKQENWRERHGMSTNLGKKLEREEEDLLRREREEEE